MDPQAWAGTVFLMPERDRTIELFAYEEPPSLGPPFPPARRMGDRFWLLHHGTLSLPEDLDERVATWPDVSMDRRTQLVRMNAWIAADDPATEASALDRVVGPLGATATCWVSTQVPVFAPRFEIVGNWTLPPVHRDDVSALLGDAWGPGSVPWTFVLSNHDGDVWPDSPIRWARLTFRHF